VQNALTDYDFKIENLEIETRIENSQINPNELPKAKFEVLDWKNMRVSFQLDEQSQKLLGGRRLQFRIKDKLRGESDWYTIRKTFVRTPEINSVRCTNNLDGNCELKGIGIDYIKQISVDGGNTWYPQEPATLVVQQTSDGRQKTMIPRISNLKLLQIRLGDLPAADGLGVYEYGLMNTPGNKK
jgi:hypothetical protein